MDNYDQRAVDDFNRARNRAVLSRILSMLRNRKDEMLSLAEVKALVKPNTEVYGGMQTVAVDLIVGSEGRYRDFNRFFLPLHRKMQGRWVNVDMAHYQQIILPAVTLYEVGGAYFVRDGNHRVSVARSTGVDFVDAEVTSLKTRIEIKPGMSRQELKRAVIDLEKRRFFQETGLDRLRPGVKMEFSATGRYDEIVRHIDGHKYYLNQSEEEEIPFERALVSWHDQVFDPIVQLIRKERILSHFPGRSASDLYVWIVRHWDDLKKRFGDFPLEDAAADFTSRYSERPKNSFARLLARLGLGSKKSDGDPPAIK